MIVNEREDEICRLLDVAEERLSDAELLELYESQVRVPHAHCSMAACGCG